MTIEALRQKFTSKLPGEAAQDRMSPQPKYVEGKEGIHQGLPINSAVMLLLIPHQGDLAIPFIKRTNVGKYHGGQIALPGGKTEPGDGNSLHTALRECEEEIGVTSKEVTVIGELSDVYIPLSNFNITPFVGTIPEMPNFVLSKNEVEKVIIIPLKDLLDDRNKTSQVLDRQEQKIIAPGYKIGENFIWGATAMMIAELEALVKNEQ